MHNIDLADYRILSYYEDRYRSLEIESIPCSSNDLFRTRLSSQKLRKDNYPFLIYHNKNTTEFIVLVNGLTDSPYYVSAFRKHFFENCDGAIYPLFPANRFKEPMFILYVHVNHDEVILEHNIYTRGAGELKSPISRANPQYQMMIVNMLKFYRSLNNSQS
jgi:hypothetical protein